MRGTCKVRTLNKWVSQIQYLEKNKVIFRNRGFSSVANGGFSKRPYSDHSCLDINNKLRNFGLNGLINKRYFSYSSIPKFFIKTIRVPAAFGSATAAGVAYVHYQVQGAAAYSQEKIKEAEEAIGNYWNNTKNYFNSITNIDLFSSLKKSSSSSENDNNNSGNDNNNEKNSNNNNNNNNNKNVAIPAGVVSSSIALNSDEDPSNGDKKSAEEDQIMVLTRKMIEIRNILSVVDQNNSIQLPSIVVIGSQSSGKSSVLEAIVGREFLPKGLNMVTKRPIELTLINTPETPTEYGVFPDLKSDKIFDFIQIQKTLNDLNVSVPETETVTDVPIRLEIYSSKVPDLSLIDLPGYIQLAAFDQPESLKSKISDLCDKYINAPNIILAISPADVDLANSTALRASRRVDPLGERTIGVVTKMDLVSPEAGVSILNNNKYPLRMGYVGVISKPPPVGLFARSTSLSSLIQRHESQFFNESTLFSNSKCLVGTDTLKKRLMYILEETMARNLQPTANAIQEELEEASYQFKVEYNDRVLTPETYLAESLDAFKISFNNFSHNYGREQVRSLIRSKLDEKVLDILAKNYWNPPFNKKGRNDTNVYELSTAKIDDLFWRRKLEASTSGLTKLGIGRLSTGLVISSLTSAMDYQIQASPFKTHPFARDNIIDATAQILNEKYYSTSDQVENCIKPYKYEIEVDDREWASSRDHAYTLLKEELVQCDRYFKDLQSSIGKKKLSEIISLVSQRYSSNSNNHGLASKEDYDGFGYSDSLLDKGKTAYFLQQRSDILKLRMAAIKSRQCKNKNNKMYCPEIFLDIVADKLAQTAVLFINVELLSDFFYNFPRELDDRLDRKLTGEQVEAFAKEDPRVRRHLELQRKKELLELALDKIDGVIALQSSRRIRETI